LGIIKKTMPERD